MYRKHLLRERYLGELFGIDGHDEDDEAQGGGDGPGEGSLRGKGAPESHVDDDGGGRNRALQEGDLGAGDPLPGSAASVLREGFAAGGDDVPSYGGSYSSGGHRGYYPVYYYYYRLYYR